MNIVFVGALKGAGDTRFILYTTLGMSGMPIALTWLGIDMLDRGIYWCWTIVTLWVMSIGSIYFGRFLQGRWRSMRVIEHAPQANLEPESTPVLV